MSGPVVESWCGIGIEIEPRDNIGYLRIIAALHLMQPRVRIKLWLNGLMRERLQPSYRLGPSGHWSPSSFCLEKMENISPPLGE